MNKIISILLSFLLFFNSSLFTIIYSIKLFDIKYSGNIELKNDYLLNNEKIDPGNIHILSFPLSNIVECKKSNLVWTEENEFILKGHYCDIVSKRVIGDTLIIIYIHDNAEDELKFVYSIFIQDQEEQNLPMKYFNVLFTFLTNVILQKKYELKPPVVNYNKFFANNFSYLSINPEISEPPPKFKT